MDFYQAALILRNNGWTFIDHDCSRTERVGWWVLFGTDDVRGMRRGDPKPYLDSALETVRLYVELVR